MSRTGPKRTPTQIVRDRLFIADRYCRGDRQVDIAAALGVAQSQISYDLAAIRQAWQREMVATVDRHKATELAKIDALEREYWTEYERSKAPFAKTVQYAESAKEKDDKSKMVRAVKTTEERLGDSRYLAGIQWCIGERCKILGLYAPQQIDIEHRVRAMAAELGLDEAEAVAIADEYVRGLKVGR